MLRSIIFPAVFAALGLASTSYAATRLPAELSGCWESDHQEIRSIEVWMAPSSNQMLGFAETRMNGKTVSWEFLRIEKSKSGLSYHAMPSGQEPTQFNLLSDEDGVLVFENPDHDFPQRVIYWIPQGEELRASIEGVSGGELQVIPFNKQKFDCSSLWQ